MTSRGRFLVLSGGEGSGKTTLIERLHADHPEFVVTREPGGTAVGARIREILLDDAHLDPQPQTELFLFFADRAEHVTTVLRPALEAGQTVITDRYWMDTYAYQWRAAMQQSDDAPFMTLVNLFHFPIPDRWIWLDVEPAVGMTRRRGTTLFNRIDARALAFHERVREGYARLASRAPFPVDRIDANRTPDEVYADVVARLAAR